MSGLAEEHATNDDLELLAMNRLPPEQAGPIGVHLERCAFCRERLAKLIVYIAALRANLSS